MRLNQFKNVAFALILTLGPISALAQNQCAPLFSQQPSVVITAAATNGVPLYENTVGQKKVPTILVNQKTFPQLQASLQKTLGIVVTHQHDYTNDHGLMRIGDFFIDRDTPGYRARGEINQTGLSWAYVSEYVAYTYQNMSYNRIEVLFELSDTEYNTAMAYQKMRRAGTIRPDFSFGNDTNPKDANNRLNSGGEICFSFSCGSAVGSHTREIETHLMQAGIQDLTQFLHAPDVKAFLEEGKQQLLNADLSAQMLSPRMHLKNSHADAIAHLMNLEMNSVKLNAVLNWIIGLRLSQDYGDLLKALSIQNSSSFSNVSSPRATAVLVYDGDVNAAHFQSTEYASKGIFSTWTHQ